MNNKILNVRRKVYGFILIFHAFFTISASQSLPVSRYGLPIINSPGLYKESLKDHPEKEMVGLSACPGIVLSLRYAGSDNFLHKKLYPGKVSNTFLRKPVLEALIRVNRELNKKGMMLVVYDAYRPYSVTETIWETVKDDRYAADPANGSGHNRGVAVDLTIADLKSGQLLRMPTDFDNFTDSARQDFPLSDSAMIRNRNLLRELMMKNGFLPLSTEWWHFSWPDPGKFEVMDLSFEEF